MQHSISYLPLIEIVVARKDYASMFSSQQQLHLEIAEILTN